MNTSIEPAVPPKTQKLVGNPAWTLIAAFGTYFCMYGLRKPYTAATYSDVAFLGMNYKYLLIIAQTIGYVIAKWLGIKFVSEIRPEQRIKTLLGLLLFAEAMLLLFALAPRPWNILCLLLNGLPLGLVFGLVLRFLEGRKNTEALVAGLCASFIVSDGVTKSAGSLLLDRGVSENWMPFFAGLLFMLPIFLFVTMLSYVPVPTPADIASRSERTPMKAKARWAFFVKFAPGLIGIVLIYLFVTLLRSIRADFAPELWKDLGYPQTPGLFTQSELCVSFGVVVINGLAILVLNHYKAFRFSLFTSLAGFALLPLAVCGLQAGLGKFPFMVLIGLGVYIPYVAVHTTIFERLIAMTKERANIGFLMYLADSVGYTGYIILMFFRYAVPSLHSILSIFLQACVFLGICGALLIVGALWYFSARLKSPLTIPSRSSASARRSGLLTTDNKPPSQDR
jgi:uncharacterized membrane protein